MKSLTIFALAFIFNVDAQRSFGREPGVATSGDKYRWQRDLGTVLVDETAYAYRQNDRVAYVSRDKKLSQVGIEPATTFYDFREGDVAIRPVSHSIYACFLIDSDSLDVSEDFIFDELRQINGTKTAADLPLTYVAEPMGIIEVYRYYRASSNHRESCNFRRLYRAHKVSDGSQGPAGSTGWHFLTLNYRVVIYVPNGNSGSSGGDSDK